MDLHVCDYLGSTGEHLCFNDGDQWDDVKKQSKGYSSGLIKFLDNTYTPVGDNFTAVNKLEGPDLHELNVPQSCNGQSFLQDIYHPVQTDLSPVGGASDGFAMAGCFQEIDIASRTETFEWCSLDHVPLTESTMPLGKDPAGTGAKDSPYDYFHLNAIDKDENGDYLISSRHCDTLYKIAGNKSPNPGEIIWRLGGKHNNFTNQGNFNFSRQHMGRFQGATGSTTNISLFDNGADGGATPDTDTSSSGMIVSLDTDKSTATLLEQYAHPETTGPGESGKSASQGSFQLLPNGNRFLGWGADASLSEHAPDGEVLYYARFQYNSFRAFRSAWAGYPTKRPDILAYAQNCSAPITIYVSWNGATEVSSWKVYSSNSSDGNFHMTGAAPKKGFETSVGLNNTSFDRFVYAEALDARGDVMNSTLAVPVWVPKADLANSCNSTMCQPGKTSYAAADAGSC